MFLAIPESLAESKANVCQWVAVAFSNISDADDSLQALTAKIFCNLAVDEKYRAEIADADVLALLLQDLKSNNTSTRTTCCVNKLSMHNEITTAIITAGFDD
ncbi:hypothetical protein BG011_007823 [Mortierella polycephala]|uniref:Uncharacterized protein n=1 Tax=Mortierella polycephala TaxID=41804 RepID=A0A9P6PSG5_9FUNG|nr:hypothetical protein BG011_007823 [Mortierella polycephala]